MKYFTFSFFVLSIFFLGPLIVSANYYTLPIDTSDEDITTTYWFDHDNDVGEEMYYDGDNGTARGYDQHHGTDYGTSGVEEKEVKAAADGLVIHDGWQNPGDHSEGYGYRIYLYHSDYEQTTVYAHATTTADYVDVNDTVSREDVIILSGDTGTSEGAHLHFGVYRNGSTTDASNLVDTYGWWATTTDPWINNNDYLWTTDPPSFDLARTQPAVNITSTTTWRGNIVVNGVVTVVSGVTLNIDPGTIMKFKTTTSRLVADGIIDAQGSSASPIYFTSYKDDTVGGDTNSDGDTTSPAAENWCDIKTGSTGSTTLSNTVVRYGGYRYCSFVGDRSAANVYNKGGLLNISDSVINTGYSCGVNSTGTTTITNTEIYGSMYGVYNFNATMNISDSNIHDNSIQGFHSIQLGGTISVVDTTFSNNTHGSGYINGGLEFTHSGNSVSGTGKQGFLLGNSVGSDVTWYADNIPYFINGSLAIGAGKTATVESGAIIKFETTISRIVINGTLDVQGSTTSPVYFTSMADDTVGGDTGGNGTSTGAAGDWKNIELGSTGSTTLSNTVVRYGGKAFYGGDSSSNIYNNGGILNVFTAEVATSSYYGIRTDSGTTTVLFSKIHDNSIGLYFSGGSGASRIASTSIHDNSVYGVNNSVATTLDAEDNFWGIAGGPNDAGGRNPGADKVSTFVDYTPWLDSDPWLYEWQ